MMKQQRQSIKMWKHDPMERRRETLKQQREARRNVANHARQLAMSEVASPSDLEVDLNNITMTDEDANDSTLNTQQTHISKRKTREYRVFNRRYYYSKQLLVPEWMLDVPTDLNGKNSDLGQGWYVLPRPEGKRCIVIASGGVTIARLQSGSILKKFPSALPNGSRKTMTSTENYCILDCIYHEPDATFYVLDLMCWKGYLLYDCTTDFRMFWLRDKMSEGNCARITSANPHPFSPVPVFECDPEGIQLAYNTPFPFLKDGLLFYLKASHYQIGLTPLSLVWKDAKCSRYFVYSSTPTIALQLNNSNEFQTLEGLKLLEVDELFMKKYELEYGDLATFIFSDAVMLDGIERDGNRLLLPPESLSFVKRCSPQRALADSWTKILFQYQARCHTSIVTIERILQVAVTPLQHSASEVCEAD